MGQFGVTLVELIIPRGNEQERFLYLKVNIIFCSECLLPEAKQIKYQFWELFSDLKILLFCLV